MEPPQTVSEAHIYSFLERLGVFRIDYSDDNSAWKTAKKVDTGIREAGKTDHKNYTIKFKPVEARFFRLFIEKAYDAPSIFEFELYDGYTMKYKVDAVSGNKDLGAVSGLNKTYFKDGETFSIKAEPTETGKFRGWSVPEGTEFVSGDATKAEITIKVSGSDLAITAEFDEKTPAVVSAEEVEFDKYEKSENNKDITVTLTENDYTLKKVVAGVKELTEGTEYTKSGNTFTFKKDFLMTLEKDTDITFTMNAGKNPAVSVKVKNSDPEIAITKDFDALKVYPYVLKNGAYIDAYGENGTEFTVKFASEKYVSVVRDTIDGKVVNKLRITKPEIGTTVAFTITATLGNNKAERKYKGVIEGKGVRPSGNGGGSGGSNHSGGSGFVSNNDGMTGGNTAPENAFVPEETGFKDLDSALWAKKYIDTLYEKGIVSGDLNGNFNPDNSIKREEFVKMLVGVLGLKPTADKELPFTDVSKDDWSYGYIVTAVEKGLINGISEDEFGYGEIISRQDMATIVSRGTDGGETAEASQFTDNEEIADYAKESIDKMVQMGIISGYPDGSFRPGNSVSRAEASKVLYYVLTKEASK